MQEPRTRDKRPQQSAQHLRFPRISNQSVFLSFVPADKSTEFGEMQEGAHEHRNQCQSHLRRNF